MIIIKKPEEIELMKQSGQKLKAVVKKLIHEIRPGLTTAEIDQKAEKLIHEIGGEPAFKKVPGYHWATCIPINEQIVHTPPSQRVIKKGDVVCLDIGLTYKDYCSDFATTLLIGEDKKISSFLEIGRRTLYKAIKKARVGHYLGEISQTIDQEISGQGYYVIRELSGHGIGRSLHEDPLIPGFLDRPISKTPKLKPGMTLAIEIIYSMGTNKMSYQKNSQWSIVTADGSLSACFEHTIAILEKETIILT
ncbi:MAG: type I methionyl aminopeptidase [Microgenomates group bacterium]|nr:type I methionyl aminopeptidase [Microgenomates group bacterium]